MGNVLDCSTDPLDQIHESDSNQPTEVDPMGGSVDDTLSPRQLTGVVGNGPVGEEKPNLPRSRPEVLYFEKGVPLRDSIMWSLQREYYTAHHVQCWEKMVVPCFVTSNSFIARAYARILVGFMRDWFLFSGKADQSEPMLILEIGAGHGKFTCLVLQHLLEMREFLPTLSQGEHANGGVPDERGGGGSEKCETDETPEGGLSAAATVAVGEGAGANHAGGGGARKGMADGLPFRYVMTDVAQGTLDYVRSHSSMQGFLDQGVLEVALLDAEDPNPPGELLFQVSGKVVDLKSTKNPIATVCNYVFDSLRQDAFRVKDKTLYENRVTITAAKPLPADKSKLSLNALQGLGLKWSHRAHAVTPERARAYYAGLETAGNENPNNEATAGVDHQQDEEGEGGGRRGGEGGGGGGEERGKGGGTAPSLELSPDKETGAEVGVGGEGGGGSGGWFRGSGRL